jgi:hypothetical protein
MAKIYKEQENLFNPLQKRKIWGYMYVSEYYKREHLSTKTAKCCVFNFQEWLWGNN